MMDLKEIEKDFFYFGKELMNEMHLACDIIEVPGNTELVREGQFVKVVPIVLKGLVKVFIGQEDKELLLYYIQPKQSCIMSFSAALKNEKSNFFAITEKDSTVLVIPADKLSRWVTEYPTINKLFYQQFDMRYTELIDTINHLLFDKLDKRLFDYLSEKISISGINPIKISHKQIANDLGTAREVISRLIKKLENQQKLKQHHDSIEIY
jgi:CRP/FNR family transcriptional regulator, anaerobic regulatory protein